MTTRPFGIHALVFQGGTTAHEVHDIARRAAASGYDLLELSLHDTEHLEVAQARETIASAGLDLVCSRGLAFDADPSSDDIEIVKRGAQLLADSLEYTEKLGGKMLTGALYGALGKYTHPLSPGGRHNVVSVLKELSADAAGRGITLGVEVCNRYETNVVNTGRDALRLIDDVGADNVVLHLDSYHMNIEESNLTSAILDAGDRLGYVHIGENHRGYLGSGHIDFPAFFQALQAIDYRGAITFESFSSAVVSPTLSIDLAIWRDLWQDGDDLARHALEMMRGWSHAAEHAS